MMPPATILVLIHAQQQDKTGYCLSKQIHLLLITNYVNNYGISSLVPDQAGRFFVFSFHTFTGL